MHDTKVEKTEVVVIHHFFHKLVLLGCFTKDGVTGILNVLHMASK